MICPTFFDSTNRNNCSPLTFNVIRGYAQFITLNCFRLQDKFKHFRLNNTKTKDEVEKKH